MLKYLVSIAMLASVVALAVVACGGGEDDEEAAPAAAAVEPTATVVKERFMGVLVPAGELVPVDLSKEGDVVDLTVTLHDGTWYVQGAPPMRYEPMEMTFRVGQTVNFTLEFADPDSRFKHSFTSQALGLDVKAAYGQSTAFTQTFDKPGLFFVHDTAHHQMKVTISVVE